MHNELLPSAKSESHSVMSDPLQPMDYTVHGILQAMILEWVAYSFSSGIPLTQESNQSLLHCRQILYQLSFQGSLQSAGKGSN